MLRRANTVFAFFLALAFQATAYAQEVRLKDLGRLEGWRENALVGYGIVTGLSGSGDSSRNVFTQQMLRNVLSRLGLNVAPEDVSSRNVAAVSVTAILPAATKAGDRIDVAISSIGDARSLVGGTLLMTPLLGPDQRSYAIAQGPVAVGGFQFDSNLNSEQRNYPASGVISSGGSVEISVSSSVVRPDRHLNFILRDADYTTATRVADAINAAYPTGMARVEDANAIVIDASKSNEDLFRIIAKIENIGVTPSDLARVVVNERSGTVVAGGDVRLSSVVISQGDIRVSVKEENFASQPFAIAGVNPGVRSLIVSNTQMSVTERKDAIASFPNTTIADLIQGLNALHVDTRSKIAILQALKAAGALHADLLVQ